MLGSDQKWVHRSTTAESSWVVVIAVFLSCEKLMALAELFYIFGTVVSATCYRFGLSLV